MKMKFFSLAKSASKMAKIPGLPIGKTVGAVIVYCGMVVAVGYNRMDKTHPKAKTKFNTIHAEFDAIQKARARLSPSKLASCHLYVYRETSNGEPALSRPCAGCLEAIKNAGITKIFYSVTGGFSKEDLNFKKVA